jgi:hypothetical protein
VRPLPPLKEPDHHGYCSDRGQFPAAHEPGAGAPAAGLYPGVEFGATPGATQAKPLALVLCTLWLVLAWRGSGRPYHLRTLHEPLVAEISG